MTGWLLAVAAMFGLVAPGEAGGPFGSGVGGDWTQMAPAISSASAFESVRDNNGVLIIGDSIAKANSPACAQRIADTHGLPVAVNNWPGRPTTPAIDWLTVHTSLIPERGVVVAVGTNDIFSPAGWWRQVRRLMEAVPPDVPVFWVTVYAERASSPTADLRNSGWINSQLRTMQTAHSNLVVVDWFAAVAAGRGGVNVSGWLSDGVHTTAAGSVAWCDLILSSMQLGET